RALASRPAHASSQEAHQSVEIGPGPLTTDRARRRGTRSGELQRVKLEAAMRWQGRGGGSSPARGRGGAMCEGHDCARCAQRESAALRMRPRGLLPGSGSLADLVRDNSREVCAYYTTHVA